MLFPSLIDCYPIIGDIINEYRTQRMGGIGRDAVLDLLFHSYNEELKDSDDRPAIYIALALALCKKHELVEQIKDSALAAIEQLKNHTAWNGNKQLAEEYKKLYKHLSAETCGAEAVYKSQKCYNPGWNYGDTFVHSLSHPMAKTVGLNGWCVVFRKVNEYQDALGHNIQLVYTTVCPTDSIPNTAKELQSLGYLRMMEHDKGWDYLGQLYFKNKVDEQRWQLQKIGCFPDVECPKDAMPEDPRVSMPFFGTIHRNSKELDYEKDICRIYKTNGVNKD